MANKWLILLVSVPAALGILVLNWDPLIDVEYERFDSSTNPSSSYPSKLNRDLAKLLSNPLTSVYLKNIKEQKITQSLPLPLQQVTLLPSIVINKNGQYRLEIFLFQENLDDPQSRIMAEISVYDVESGNKLWEESKIY